MSLDGFGGVEQPANSRPKSTTALSISNDGTMSECRGLVCIALPYFGFTERSFVDLDLRGGILRLLLLPTIMASFPVRCTADRS
jgi:hypothetical protein